MQKKATQKKARLTKRNLDAVRGEYARLRPDAERLLSCLREQLPTIIDQSNVSLGVPIESRLKSQNSIEEKFKRKSYACLSDINDMVGLRMILLFKEDVEKLDGIIRSVFVVEEFDDTAKRLTESQFGYQSNHYIVRLPDEWLKIPSYFGLGALKAELQVRTLAQHIWAATSHKLQYKREDSVPLPLRRSIHRVSALLETVDLEFSRVLTERQRYSDEISPDHSTEELNVDILAKKLIDIWPKANLDNDEPYDDLLKELSSKGIRTSADLSKALKENHQIAIKEELKAVSNADYEPEDPDFDEDRYARGVYFTHVGLTRMAISMIPDEYSGFDA